MFQTLVSHNDDLNRLVQRGFAVAFDSNCLIIRDIPYLDNDLKLQWGAIVSKLVFVDREHVAQDDHQIYFAGVPPHNIDGKPIPNLGGGPTSIKLSEAFSDVVVQRSFSNKPRKGGKFNDFFDKIESYVAIISGPAMELYKDATPYTYRICEVVKQDSIFKFHDTLTSRAEISDLADKFKNEIVAIIGLGGTGAYLLDFLIKTPVREIRAFDHDIFQIHNSYRSPGKLDEGELGKNKAGVYCSRYDNFRTGLLFEPKLIDSSSISELDDVTFAFVCVDKGTSRSEIIKLLISKNIPFIDVGMGLKRKDGPLDGMIRTTFFPREDAQKIFDMRLVPVTDSPDDIYKTNIQIAELNALNACLAIIRYKQLRGFYYEELPVYNLLFGIGDISLTRSSGANES